MKKYFYVTLLTVCISMTNQALAQSKKAWATICNGTMTFMYGYKPSAPSTTNCYKCKRRISYNDKYCSNCGHPVKKDFVVYEVPMSAQRSDINTLNNDAWEKAVEDVTSRIPWHKRIGDVKKVVFEPSFRQVTTITSTSFWFYNEDWLPLFGLDSELISISGLEYLNTSNVKYMGAMFWGCSELKSINVSHFRTERVKEMWGMFFGCQELSSLNLSNFDTRNVVDMNSMFFACSSLSSVNVSNFITNNVRNMNAMFMYCEKLTSLNLTSFNTKNTLFMNDMFASCEKLTQIYISSSGWDLRRARANRDAKKYYHEYSSGVDGMLEDCPARFIRR